MPSPFKLLKPLLRAGEEAGGLAKAIPKAGGLAARMGGEVPAASDELAAKIRAWHASPHDFDEFKFSQDIEGTGEGAAAYGSGLYLAESPAVSGKGGIYDKQFSKPDKPATVYEVDINAHPDQFLDWYKPLREQEAVFNKVTDHYGGRNALIQRYLETEQAAKEANAADATNVRELEDRFWNLSKRPGSRVGNIVHQMERPPSTWNQDPGAKFTGESLYSTMGRQYDTSMALKEMGIPGIKYADFGSRGALSDDAHAMAKNYGSRERALEVAQERLRSASMIDGSNHYWQRMVKDLGTPQTSNFVVFDPKIIDIVGKYGIAGALGAGLISQAQADQLQRQQGGT